MGYSWKIRKAAVEQEIEFPSKFCFVAYIKELERKEEPFEYMILSENEDGSLIVNMRKRYNFNEFLESPFYSKANE